jgi:DNA-binding response OmpR family regulator
VLLVDHDRDVLAQAAFHIAAAGYRVATARSAADAIASAREQTLSLAVLGPVADSSPAELIARLRRLPGVKALPVLVVLPDVTDSRGRVAALTAGADDCLPRGVDPYEIVLRLQALRRWLGARGAAAEVLRIGPIEIDLDAYAVSVDERPIALTRGEFAILCALAEQPGRMSTHQQLAERIYGDRRRGLTRSITVRVSRLRAKLGDAAKVVETVRGVGYRLRARSRSSQWHTCRALSHNHRPEQ